MDVVLNVCAFENGAVLIFEQGVPKRNTIGGCVFFEELDFLFTDFTARHIDRSQKSDVVLRREHAQVSDDIFDFTAFVKRDSRKNTVGNLSLN